MGAATHLSLFDLIVGTLLVVAIMLGALARRWHVPPLVFLILVGFLVRLIDDSFLLLTSSGHIVLEFLAGTGLIMLLFRVGLESNLHDLAKKLPQALPIWAGNIVLSGVPSFAATHFLFGYPLVPSLVFGVAMTATSIAVPLAVWREAGAVDSPNGQLFIDVAELDDVSAVAMMAILFAVTPILLGQSNGGIGTNVTETIVAFVLKAGLFGALCFVFAKWAERPIVTLLTNSSLPAPIIAVVGIGMGIAAVAGLLGLSFAIGALFAGLVFSRDPRAVTLETSFGPIFEFFVPFFFISIGMKFDPNFLVIGVSAGTVLFFVAAIGKIIGAGAPAVRYAGWVGAAVIGLSMVPRAEIAMVVLQSGAARGAETLPLELFAAGIVVCFLSCLTAPLAVRWIFGHAPTTAGARASRSKTE